MKLNLSEINYLMSVAVDEAQVAFSEQEVPVGCLVVDELGNILSQTHNIKERTQNSCDHAEILAIREASEKLGNWRLQKCSLVVTLEPCPMCLGAMSQSRIENLYFGAFDPKGGAISLGLGIHKDPRLNHKVNVIGGIRHLETGKLLSDFFKSKRKNYSSKP